MLCGYLCELLQGLGERGRGQALWFASPELPSEVTLGSAVNTLLLSQVGHALVGTAVARLLPGSPEVEKLSIIPRSGGALGFTYSPPKAEDRALLFDREIRGQLVSGDGCL